MEPEELDGADTATASQSQRKCNWLRGPRGRDRVIPAEVPGGGEASSQHQVTPAASRSILRRLSRCAKNGPPGPSIASFLDGNPPLVTLIPATICYPRLSNRRWVWHSYLAPLSYRPVQAPDLREATLVGVPMRSLRRSKAH
jgi:hypothetical protein